MYVYKYVYVCMYVYEYVYIFSIHELDKLIISYFAIQSMIADMQLNPFHSFSNDLP